MQSPPADPAVPSSQPSPMPARWQDVPTSSATVAENAPVDHASWRTVGDAPSGTQPVSDESWNPWANQQTWVPTPETPPQPAPPKAAFASPQAPLSAPTATFQPTPMPPPPPSSGTAPHPVPAAPFAAPGQTAPLPAPPTPYLSGGMPPAQTPYLSGDMPPAQAPYLSGGYPPAPAAGVGTITEHANWSPQAAAIPAPLPPPPSGYYQPGVAYAPVAKTETKLAASAVAALVLGIIGLLLFFTIIAPVIGAIVAIVALKRIENKKRRLHGRGLAVAGAVCSIVGVLVFVTLFLLASTGVIGSGDSPRSQAPFAPLPAQPAPVQPKNSPLSEVEYLAQVGDCVDLPDEGVIFQLTQRDCAIPHAGEVAWSGPLTDAGVPVEGVFPGAAVVERIAVAQCTEALAQYTGVAYEDSPYDVYFVHPIERGWNVGDRGVTCIVYDPTGNVLTGSVQG